MFTGNRGCLVDDREQIVRHHASSLWIVCLTEFKDWRVGLARPRRWTPIFFLDDAVALAAGHRPCATCRREAYVSYRDAITASEAHPGQQPRLLASEINARLARERLVAGRGLLRVADRRTWQSDFRELPVGSVVVFDERARLVTTDNLLRFTSEGWTDPIDRPTSGHATVLTPPTSVAALRHGFEPTLHPTARV
jgi:hypothetical protein